MIDEVAGIKQDASSVNGGNWRSTIRWRRLLLGSAISLFLLWLAFRSIPAGDVLAVLRTADYRFVLLALLVVLVSPLVRAIRCRLLFYPDQQGLSRLRLAEIILIGQMLNILIPARIGELARIHFLASTQNRSRMLTLGTIVLEKWLDLLLLLIVSILVLLLVPTPSWFRDTRLSLAAISLLFLLLAVVALRYRTQILAWTELIIQRFPERWHLLLQRAAASALASLDVLRSSRMRVHLIAWSAVVWGLSIAVNYLVMLALGIELPITVAIFLLVALNVGVIVPSAPASLGVFHIICILTLGLFGVPSDLALSYAILLHAIVFLPPIVLGAAGLWWETAHKKPSASRPS